MIRDITVGQYYASDSAIHRLDPRVKILGTMAFVVMLFIINDIYSYAFSILALALVIAVSKVPSSFIFRGIKSILFIIFLTAILNVITTKGTHILLQVGIIKVTLEGVYMAIKMVVRLIMLIIGSSLLTLTTTPIQLTDGIESLLKPFRKIGVPSAEIAMMMSIALRFVPTLLDETDKIMKAQQARGADFETGGLKQKAQSLVPVLVPLFVSAFRRADELATAMEARCYHGGNNRTRMNKMVLKGRDYKASAIIVLYIAITVAIMIIW